MWDVLDIDREPELHERLLKGEINRVTCASCAGSFAVSKPLVYRHLEQELMVFLDPVNNGRTLDEVVADFSRTVGNLDQLMPTDVPLPEIHLVIEPGELVERIFLREQQMDARLVEHIKYLMYRRNPEKLPAGQMNLLFNPLDSTPEQLCFMAQNRATGRIEAALHFQRSDYDALAEAFAAEAGPSLLEEQFPGPYFSGRLLVLQDLAEEAAEAEEEG